MAKKLNDRQRGLVKYWMSKGMTKQEATDKVLGKKPLQEVIINA